MHERLALPPGRTARHVAGRRHLCGHVFHLHQQSPCGILRQRRGDRRQQGCASGAGGDGADRGGADPGIDLSVGMIFLLTNCVASYIVSGSTPMAILGLIAVLLVGLACGAINGLIVIYGRLQPIVTTIATGSIFYGIALWMRPQPGTSDGFDSDIADFMTGKLPGGIPMSVVALIVVVLV